MASKRRNWLRRQARKNWMHDSKGGNRSALDKARGRYDYGFEAIAERLQRGIHNA